MRRKRNFRKRPKDTAVGLAVTVYDNNVDKALRILKKKVKNSNLMMDLKKKEYYVKPSKIKREKKNLAILRNRYRTEKSSK